MYTQAFPDPQRLMRWIARPFRSHSLGRPTFAGSLVGFWDTLEPQRRLNIRRHPCQGHHSFRGVDGSGRRHVCCCGSRYKQDTKNALGGDQFFAGCFRSGSSFDSSREFFRRCQHLFPCVVWRTLDFFLMKQPGGFNGGCSPAKRQSNTDALCILRGTLYSVLGDNESGRRSVFMLA